MMAFTRIWTAIPSLAEMDMKGQYHVGRSTQVRSPSKLFHGTMLLYSIDTIVVILGDYYDTGDVSKKI